MVGDPNPSSAESPSWLIRSVTRDEVEDSNAEISGFFNNKIKQRTETTPKGKNKQAGRRLEHSQHETHMTKTHERQRISTGLQTQGELYRETNEGNEGDTAGATETMIK